MLFLRIVSRSHSIYGRGREIEPHTFIDIPEMPAGATPHHYFSEEELRGYLERFEVLKLEHKIFPPVKDEVWKHGLAEWVALARKLE